MRSLQTVTASTIIAQFRRGAQGQMSHRGCGNVCGEPRDAMQPTGRTGTASHGSHPFGSAQGRLFRKDRGRVGQWGTLSEAVSASL